MSKRLLPLCLLLSLSPLTRLVSAEPVRFPTGNQSWTVDVRYTTPAPAQPAPAESDPQKSPAVPPRPTRFECTSYGGTEHYRITWSNRQTTDVWKQQGIALATDPASGKIGLSNDTLVSGLINSLDASLFSWISGTGTETTFEKRKALFYEKAARSGSPGESLDTDAWRRRQAWIDQETLLPLAYDNGQATFLFSYESAPPGPLSMPADFARLHARILSTMSQLPSWKKTP